MADSGRLQPFGGSLAGGSLVGGSLARPPWWRGAVLYQIYPRSFRDSNGDGTGDLGGIIAGLPYVASLGVDGVWIGPFFPSPMADFGYDVADYCSVDPLFGSLADADRLIETAHRHGLKIIIDMVLSHSSDAHAWFQESRQDRVNPKADWYVWADARPDGSPPSNWLSVFGGTSWQWDAGRGQFYLHNFLASQPDLNLHHPDVQQAVLDACQFWLERGVDGFRLDVANYYTHDRLLRDNPLRGDDGSGPDGVPDGNPYARQRHLYDKSQPETFAILRRLRALTDRYPDRFTVAEVHDDDSVATSAAYVADDSLLHTAYGFALLGPEFSAGAIRRHIQAFEGQPGNGWPAWSFSNHDSVRVVSRWSGTPAGQPVDLRFAGLLNALLLSLRGTLFLYQGEELGLPEADIAFDDLQDPYGRQFWPVFKGRDGCRTPMPWQADHPQGGFCPDGVRPWLPMPALHRALAIDRQQNDPDSVLTLTRQLLKWRRADPALRLGSINLPLPPAAWPPELLIVERHLGERCVTGLFNLSVESCVLTGATVECDPEISGAIRRLSTATVKMAGFGFALYGLADEQ